MKGWWRVKAFARRFAITEQQIYWLRKHVRLDCVSMRMVRRRVDLTRIGSGYGGWVVPRDLLDEKSVCYCVGVGEDITFDLGLIEKFGCLVFAYDPTPRAVNHVARAAKGVERYRFSAVGLWSEDKVLRFWSPANPDHVSHSVVNLQKSEQFFEAPCKSLKTLMRGNGHEFIDLLKLDVEGAEYEVVNSVVRDALRIGVICVEFDEFRNPLDGRYKRRIRGACDILIRAGYRLVSIDNNCNYTFVHKGVMGRH